MLVMIADPCTSINTIFNYCLRGGGWNPTREGIESYAGGGDTVLGNLEFSEIGILHTLRVVGLCQIIYSIKVTIGKVIFRDDIRLEVPPTSGTSSPNSPKRSKTGSKRRKQLFWRKSGTSAGRISPHECVTTLYQVPFRSTKLVSHVRMIFLVADSLKACANVS